MKKYAVIFMALAILFCMVACGVYVVSNAPVDISIHSGKNTDVDTTNKGNQTSTASDTDNTVGNSDNTSSENSTANNTSSDSDATASVPSNDSVPNSDSGAGDPIDTPVNDTPPVVEPDDDEDSVPVHTHSWTDNGVAVVCPGCGMLDHGHMWDPIYSTELVDDYEMKEIAFCSTCNNDVSDLLDSGSSMKQHRQNTGCTGNGYYIDYVQVHVGSHEEQVVVGHKCSICEAEK